MGGGEWMDGWSLTVALVLLKWVCPPSNQFSFQVKEREYLDNNDVPRDTI